MPFVASTAQIYPHTAPQFSSANNRAATTANDNFDFDAARAAARKHLLFHQRPSDGWTFDVESGEIEMYLKKLLFYPDRKAKFLFMQDIRTIDEALVKGGFFADPSAMRMDRIVARCSS